MGRSGEDRYGFRRGEMDSPFVFFETKPVYRRIRRVEIPRENEVSERIPDRHFFAGCRKKDLAFLYDVRMAPDDDVRSGIDRGTGQNLLGIIRF
jgi:hypothetical protein